MQHLRKVDYPAIKRRRTSAEQEPFCQTADVFCYFADVAYRQWLGQTHIPCEPPRDAATQTE